MRPSTRQKVDSGGIDRTRTRGFFDNFTPPPEAPQRPQAAPARDTTLAQPGSGSGSGVPLDVYGQGSPAAARDIKMDPLTENEMMGYKAARAIGSGLMGPVGSAIFSAAEYNMGASGYNPAVDKSLRNDATFANTYNAGRVAEAFPDSTPGQRAGTAFATSTMGKALGAQSDFISLTDGTMMRSDGQMRTYDPEAQVAVDRRSQYSPAVQAQIEAELRSQEQSQAAAAAQAQSDAAFDRDWSAGMQGIGGGSTGGSDYSGMSHTGPGGGGTSVDSDYSGGQGYADGGMVGLTGPMLNQAPQNLTQMGFADGGAVGMGSNMGPDQLQQQINQMVRNPQFKQVAQQAVGNAMQSGELTPEELVTLGRIAEAAMHNPSLYPQLRQFASQNGLTPLPPSYDPRLVVVLIAASKIMGATQPGQVPPMDQAQMQNPNGQENGGFLQGPGTGRSDSIGTVEQSTGKPVKVANGEYVVPAHVVAAKGKDFFDKMLRQYAQLTPQE